MKQIYLANILIMLAAFTAPVSADDVLQNPPPPPADTSAMVSPDAIDPTLAFFVALSTCTPGHYTEKNILSSDVGQAVLDQQIVGLSDDKMMCGVILTTPDNRKMTCAFPVSQLPQFSDQHFLQGKLENTTINPDQDSINADMRWSQMKVDHCGLN